MPWRPTLRPIFASDTLLARIADEWLSHWEHCEDCSASDWYAPQHPLCRVGKLALTRWERAVMHTAPKSA